jgi:hypothetical protein
MSERSPCSRAGFGKMLRVSTALPIRDRKEVGIGLRPTKNDGD